MEMPWRIDGRGEVSGVKIGGGPLLEGEFIERPNRFLTRVRLGRKMVEAHLHDPGRLRELLVRGRTVYLSAAAGESRKTRYDLVMVAYGEVLVSLDSTLPNRLVYAELMKGGIASLRGYDEVRSEVRYGRSRFDFLLASPGKLCYVEVKSVTLVVDGVALFPDAVTTRGARHVRELLDARRSGHEAFVLFVVQRGDAHCMAPHDEVDPAFGQALREAVQGGVRALAYRCSVSRDRVRLEKRIEVRLGRR